MKLDRSGVRIVTLAGTGAVIVATVGLLPASAGAAALPPGDPVVVSSSAAGTPGNAPTGAGSAAWSPDGTKVAFSSTASNLVPGDTAGSVDLFVKNLTTGAITAAPGWGEHPTWSPDGKSLAYWSGGGDLCVRLMVWTPPAAFARVGAEQCGVDESVTKAPVWDPASKHVAGEIEFTWSHALWLVDLTGSTPSSRQTAARWPAWSTGGSLAVGRLSNRGIEPVGENPVATSDVTVDGDVLWAPVKLSDEFGCPEDGCWSGSWQPAWSPGGSTVAFTSDTPASGDANTTDDVFAQNAGSHTRTPVSTSASGQFGNGASRGLRATDGRPGWSPDGSVVLFESAATNLVPGDSNGVADVFAKRLGSGAIARVATAATAAGPGRWNFSGTWPTYDTVALPGAAAGSWFRSSLWNPAGTSVLYPSAGGQLLVVDAPRKQDQPVRQLTTPSIAGVTAADHAVALSWRQPQSPARITGYRIQARVGAGAWRTVVPNTGSTGTRRTITGLANGAAYRLRVAALSGARQGSWSIASPRVVPFGEPGRPGHLEASDVTKRRVTLAWDAASANGARVAYQLQKRRHGAWRTLDTTAKPHWRGKLGKPGADVVVRVLAANRAGHGPASSTITVHLRGR